MVYSTRRRAKIEGVGHEEFSKYVWLGVHKETIAVSVAEVSGGEVVNSDLKLIHPHHFHRHAQGSLKPGHRVQLNASFRLAADV